MQTRLLNEDISGHLEDIFSTQLNHNVQLIYFTAKTECESCTEAKQLLEELSNLSDKISLITFDIDENSNIAQDYDIHLTPGLVLAGKNGNELIDYGIRFYGIPSGYEFSSLINSVIMVSKRDSGLKQEVRYELNELKQPVHLKVFVTPT
jgi:alkyl hydroperoxide reductase subunit AhpF